MELTLEAIKAEHDRLGKMIADLEKMPKTTEYRVEATTIKLTAGEHYAGLILDEYGKPGHHLILLPGDVEDLDFDGENAWAAEQGGSLPTCREQSLLFSNLKGEFESAWYWSGERHESNPGWAWSQYFLNGTQYYHATNYKLRARAVRRIAIQKGEK